MEKKTLEKKSEDLENENKRLREKVARLHRRCAEARNGVKYLRFLLEKTDYSEPAPPVDETLAIGRFVEENRDLIPGVGPRGADP